MAIVTKIILGVKTAPDYLAGFGALAYIARPRHRSGGKNLPPRTDNPTSRLSNLF